MNFIGRWLRAVRRRWSSSAPPDWILSGGSTDNGLRVTPDTALTLAAVWRAVDLISGDVAKLPLHVYRRTDNEGKERALLNPAYRLVRRSPDDFTPAFYFWKHVTAQALLNGNAYAYVFRNALGSPVELMLLPSRATWPVVETTDLGRTVYYVTTATGAQRRLPASDVLHVRGMGYDGIQGYSVIGHAANSIAGAMGADRYARMFFSNGSGGRVVLEAPDAMGAEAQRNLVESWERMNSGLDNVGRTAVLEQGISAKTLNMSSSDAELLGSRQWETKQIANWFGLPPHKLGISDTGTSYNSLEQENQAYMSDTLDGWLCAIEQEATAKLISQRDRDRDQVFCEFSRNALARADMAGRSAFYHNAIHDGWMSRDEARAFENLNPIPDGLGAEFLVPLNMGVVGETEDPPAPPPLEEPADDGQADEDAPDPVARAHRALLSGILARHWHRVTEQAAKAARRPDQYLDWVSTDLIKRNAAVLRADLSAVLQCAYADPLEAVAATDRGVAVFLVALRADCDALGELLPERLAAGVDDLKANGPAAAIAATLGEEVLR